jgi:hypothetical protein
MMPSTGCAQEKVLACKAVHNGRKLSTLGISRTTLHVQLAHAGRAPGMAGRNAPRTAGQTGRLPWPRAGDAAARRRCFWMHAFPGRALASFSSIRACVRRTGDSSAGSAGLSRSSRPAPAAAMIRGQPRLPMLTRVARPGREAPGRPAGTTLTSPGWRRSGKWSPTPIPSSRSACPATYLQPNNRRLSAMNWPVITDNGAGADRLAAAGSGPPDVSRRRRIRPAGCVPPPQDPARRMCPAVGGARCWRPGPSCR